MAVTVARELVRMTLAPERPLPMPPIAAVACGRSQGPQSAPASRPKPCFDRIWPSIRPSAARPRAGRAVFAFRSEPHGQELRAADFRDQVVRALGSQWLLQAIRYRQAVHDHA